MKYLFIILILFASCGDVSLNENQDIKSDNQIILGDECGVDSVWKDYIILKSKTECINSYENEQDFNLCIEKAEKIKSYIFICINKDIEYI